MMWVISRFYKENKWPLLVFLALSFLLIFKTLYLDGCSSFGEGDERVHTFTGLRAARTMLSQGALPQINFFENFATPMFGDSFTFFFAPHSQTYWFFDSSPTAMAVNRVLISLATMIALYIFMRSYLATKAVALLVSIFIFFAPGFFEFFGSHQHQMALLTVVAVLIVLERFKRYKFGRGISLISLFIFFVVLFVSTTIDQSVTAALFLILASIFLSAERRTEAAFITVGSFLAAVVVVAPQFFAFVLHIASSVRINTDISNVAVHTQNFMQTLYDFFFPARWQDGPYNPRIYLTYLVSVGAILGAYSLLRTSGRETDRQTDRQTDNGASCL